MSVLLTHILIKGFFGERRQFNLGTQKFKLQLVTSIEKKANKHILRKSTYDMCTYVKG